MTYFELSPEARWKDETEKYWDALLAFTRRTASDKYDDPNDCYYASESMESQAYWQKEPEHAVKLTARSVEVFYKNGEINQIHGCAGSSRSNSTDIYLKGRALEDFLKGMSNE